MLPSRPPLLALPGLDIDADYDQALEEFQRLYLDPAHPIIDPLGRRVRFEPEDFIHVCYKQEAGRWDPYKRLPRDQWREDRAARIPWISIALTAPETQIRPSPVRSGDHRQSYVVIVPADSKAGLEQEFFGAFVRGTSDSTEVRFLTAYRLDLATYKKVKLGGPLLYPVKASDRAKGGK